MFLPAQGPQDCYWYCLGLIDELSANQDAEIFSCILLQTKFLQYCPRMDYENQQLRKFVLNSNLKICILKHRTGLRMKLSWLAVMLSALQEKFYNHTALV